jgi:integral membrane protein
VPSVAQISLGRVTGAPELAHREHDDTRDRDLLRIAGVLFVIGLVAIVATVVDYAAGGGNRPVWQNLLCLLAPFGFALAVLAQVRSGRATARQAALAIGQPADRPVDRRRDAWPVGGCEAAFRVVALVEAMSWLLLIVATVVKYTQGSEVAVHVLGPTHGALFMIYVGLALVVAWRRRWGLFTTGIVLAESVIPGGGLLVYRRADLRAERPAAAWQN